MNRSLYTLFSRWLFLSYRRYGTTVLKKHRAYRSFGGQNRLTKIQQVFKDICEKQNLERNEGQLRLLRRLQELESCLRHLKNTGGLDGALEAGKTAIKKQIKPPVVQQSRTTFLNSFGLILAKSPPEVRTLVPPPALHLNSRQLLRYDIRAKSLYIYGGVGGGKTLLMDVFCRCIDGVVSYKRVHFYEFMEQVHKMIHRYRASKDDSSIDTIVAIAEEIAGSIRLLCLDEFHVIHIADAMILKRLFEALLHFGVLIVTTSNRAPRDLYVGGINRDQFVPFIHMVESEWVVHKVDTGRDFRSRNNTSGSLLDLYHSPPRSLEDALHHLGELCSDNIVRHEKIQLPESNRFIRVPYSCGDGCLFSYHLLCGTHTLGPSEYLQLAERYKTFFVYDVPNLAESQSVRKFIQLIDVLYEKHRRLVLDARVPLLLLFGSFDRVKAVSNLRQLVEATFEKGFHQFLEAFKKAPGSNIAEKLENVLQLSLSYAQTIKSMFDEANIKENEVEEAFRALLLYFNQHGTTNPREEYYYPLEHFKTPPKKWTFKFLEAPGSTVQDNLFALDRALSRLVHMQSTEYHDSSFASTKN